MTTSSSAGGTELLRTTIVTEKPCPIGAPCSVRVFYATDRAPVSGREISRKYRKTVSRSYGWKRDLTERKPDYELSYGSCVVSIPPIRKEPTVSSPGRFGHVIWDAKKHDILQEITEPISFTEFRQQLNDRMKAADPTRRQVVLFIHGYNVPFEEAARRTAQMYWDLSFRGAPVFYSWPSAGKLLRYWADESSVEWTTPHLRDFLRRLALDTDADEIHLIAHSMGNRALTHALAELSSENDAIARTLADCGKTSVCAPRSKREIRFNQVVLAAPDMDRATFTQLQKHLTNISDKITLYASRRDRAVIGSWFVHYFKRLGVPADVADFVDGVDAIDATSASTGFLGHSYYGSSLLWDISNLFCQPALQPDARPTIGGKNPKGYYRFRRTPSEPAPAPLVRGGRVVFRRREPEPIRAACEPPMTTASLAPWTGTAAATSAQPLPESATP